jgi:hypothetical protein
VPKWALLVEFPDIGHAPLLEAPEEAVQIVTDFFLEALEKEGLAAAAASTVTR